MSGKLNLVEIKDLLRRGDPAFWAVLSELTDRAAAFDDLLFLSTLRRKAIARNLTPASAVATPLRLAILGGCSLYPLHEILDHLLALAGFKCEIHLGDYDNYVSELSESGGALDRFAPEVIFVVPGEQRYKYAGALTDPRGEVQAAATAAAAHLGDLCGAAHKRTRAEIVLCNFMLPARRDLGAFRARTPASDWNFRKWVNLELGLNAPPFVRICDLEYLAYRIGAVAAEDARGWFESKQPFSPAMLVEACREAAYLIGGMRVPQKKVLVLDLDNTLWGGVVADDGLEGIEIGDTSPRGEAFKAFQKCIASLKQRGVLLAVCSKNDHARAMEAFEKHPEMVLRAKDFVSFKANWSPKSDNLQEMAAELNLGIDSFVFADDNPAEIEIVRQFAPAVSTLLLGKDPADYVGQLQDCRWFEPRALTAEDAKRTDQYLAERDRKAVMATASNMDAYLESLAMVAVVREFTPVDVPRLTQLINKSNQFNLTTRRRTEAEVSALVGQPEYVTFSVRLEDRFGDHGLICIVIAHTSGAALEIDTWLMSCRVLKRQVEDLVLNELCRLGKARGCKSIKGVYLATPKNEMVRQHYPSMGFEPRHVTHERGEYTLDLSSFCPRPTKISVRKSL